MLRTLAITLMILTTTAQARTPDAVLLDDDFSGLRPGMFSAGVVGAHTEYHYLPPSLGQSNWQVSCFKSEQSQRAWRVIRQDAVSMMAEVFAADAKRPHYHHMLVAGDPFRATFPQNGPGMEVSETVLEMTYRFQLFPFLALQPNFQYIVNPGFDPHLDNAWVGALRMEIVF